MNTLKVSSTWNENKHNPQRKFANAIIEYSSEHYMNNIQEDITTDMFEDALKTWSIHNLYHDRLYADENNICEFIDKCCCGHHIQSIYILRNGQTNVILSCGKDCIEKLNPNSDIAYNQRRFMIMLSDKKIMRKRELNALELKVITHLATCNKSLEQGMRQVNNLFSETSIMFLQCMTTKVGFGKYKESFIKDVPKGYLKWYGEQRKQEQFLFVKTRAELDFMYKRYYNEQL